MLWKTRQADTKSLWIIQKYELCEIRRLQNNTHVLFWGFFIYQLFGPKCSWKRALQQSEEDFAHCVWGWFFSFNITWKWKRKHLRRGSDLDERNSLCDQVKQNSEFRSDYVSSQKARSLLAGISQTERIYGLWLPGSFSPCLHLRCCNLHPSVHQSGCGQRVSFLAVNAHVFGGVFLFVFLPLDWRCTAWNDRSKDQDICRSWSHRDAEEHTDDVTLTLIFGCLGHIWTFLVLFCFFLCRLAAGTKG